MLSNVECETLIRRLFELELENDYEVIEYELKVLELPGFYSNYFLVKIITFHREKQPKRMTTLVVKKIRDTFLEKVSLFREITSQTWLKDLNFTPKVYFSIDDNLIVYEDFISKGYVLPTNPNDLDLEHIQLVLETMAKFHVNGIKNSNLEPNKTETSIRFEPGLNLLCNLVGCMPTNTLQHEDFKNKLKDLYKKSTNLLENIKAFENIVCHGYMWGNNILFSYENGKPKQCMFINLELQHTNFPAYDVVHFLYRATTAETRQKHFHNLLKVYCDYVVKKDSTFKDRFKQSAAVLMPIVKLESICCRLIEAQPLLASSFDIECATKTLKNDKRFAMFVIESLTELNDLLECCSLTREDCYKIIDNVIAASSYKLLQYSIRPLGAIEGFLGDHNKLTISINLNNRTTDLHLFAKFMPKAESAFKTALDIGAFAKEIFVYKNFIPSLQRLGVDLSLEYAIPCYFARDNDVLVLKDFECLGYKTLDPRQPFCYKTLTLIVKKLAKFHASSIIYEEKMSKALGTKYNLKQNFQKELQEALYVKSESHNGAKCIQTGIRSMDLLLTLFPAEKPSLKDDKILKFIKETFKNMFDLVEESAEFKNVICHGDLWSNNILVRMVDNVPTDCRFIDYQLIRYCPPAHDLLALLYLTTDRSVRSKHFYDIIKVYYQELKQTLGSYDYDIDVIYPHQDFMKSVMVLKPHAICQTCIYYQLNLINQDIFKKFMVNGEVFSNVFINDRKDFIMVMYDNDPLFRRRMAEAIQDLREMCAEYVRE